jgi:adenosyl cobinamide kinase/adenosyl cobinamide phosphate guanylyltransferase
MLTVLLGGARSGKSRLAVELGQRAAGGVTYIATSPRIPGDDDLDQRIARHRLERPSEWITIEEELDLAGALARVHTELVIVDCLTTWIGNLLHHEHDESSIGTLSTAAIEIATRATRNVIVVSNEVGLGIVPANELARGYRDLLGRVNQQWVAAADRALMMVAGKAIALHDPGDLL